MNNDSPTLPGPEAPEKTVGPRESGGPGERRRWDYPLYLLIRALVRLLYPKTAVTGTENLPPEPCVIVGNHTQMNGPIISELWLPGRHYTWCAGEMMELRAVPDYAYRDFWWTKPGWCRWLYRLLSYLIAPVSVCVFNNAETIPVWHDTRILSTFRQSIRRLEEGASLVIFPERNEPYNHILCAFQDKFIDLARFYYKKTGRALCFVPLYNAPALRLSCLGTPVRFRPEVPIREERDRIRDCLMARITRMAEDLPEHTVVPYLNVPKKDYPKNIVQEVSSE